MLTLSLLKNMTFMCNLSKLTGNSQFFKTAVNTVDLLQETRFSAENGYFLVKEKELHAVQVRVCK